MWKMDYGKMEKWIWSGGDEKLMDMPEICRWLSRPDGRWWSGNGRVMDVQKYAADSHRGDGCCMAKIGSPDPPGAAVDIPLLGRCSRWDNERAS